MKTIAVIGAGTMGNGIAHTFAQSGFTVKLIDVSEKSLEKGMATIAAGQTISQPYTVAYQTQLLQVKKDDKILEIGTGSGYQTAVLCLLGAKVFSVERQNELFKITSALLPKLGIRPKHLSFGDGYKGLPNHAPFDSIIVTAGAPIIPKPLMAQLKIGGRLVIPLGKEEQIMTMLIRKNETQFEKHEFGDFKFVPLLENKN
jgi:protein-L-isoaspartate(D-aspartate) O-methyltransferase